MQTARKTAIVCTVVIAFLAVLYCLFISRKVVLFVVIALLLSFAIEPLVAWFEKMRIKRVWGAAIAMLLILIIIGGILATIVTPLVQQGIGLAQNMPAITARFLAAPTFAGLNQKYHLADTVSQLSANASAIFLGGSASLFTIAGNVISLMTATTIVFVLAYLFQVEGKALWTGLVGFMREEDRETAHRVGTRILKAVSGFVSGNIFISLIAGVVTLATLLILHVPYAFALAALVALFDLIPMIGAAIGTIVVGLVALTQGVWIAAIAVVVLLVYQFIEGHLIQPIVYSKSIDLSALLIVIASVLGAEVGGILGILLAIPLAAVIQIVITETLPLLKK